MASTKGRTVILLRNRVSNWYVRVAAAGNNERISAEESFSTPASAQRAFIAEGRHQPFAKMVVRIHGEKDLVVRPGGLLPITDLAREASELTSIRQAMKARKAH